MSEIHVSPVNDHRGGGFNHMGSILVLFILLVIIVCTICGGGLY
ncbi:hypothetical protein [Paenibacillus sp. JDR-2]|nr:hypothetical protein [Paenibacillus sp. JDR-2]ACT03485.1 hypothetical protein Pjdr2_4873 [Paenibacillus sp. JDR-2]